MSGYLRTVTLGAFTWRNEERIALLFAALRAIKGGWILLHFLLVTFCLNFPAVFVMARLPPYELYSRLFGENLLSALPHEARYALTDAAVVDEAAIENFNALMLQNGYGRRTLLPLLGLVLCVTLVIQAAFYLCAAFFLGLSRMNASALLFRSRLALAVFSSTLPVLAAAVFGLFLPTVHIIVFYFAVMFFIFQRSNRHCFAVPSD